MNWRNPISTPVQNAIKICFWFFKWKDENFKINTRCLVNKSPYVRKQTASLLYKHFENTDTCIRNCRTYCCVPFSHAAIAQLFIAVSVMQLAPGKAEWRLSLSDVQCNWLNSLSLNFPTQIFTKIHSVARRFYVRADGQNHFNRHSAETRKRLKQNYNKRWRWF
jgi:hypothetical protein